MEDYSLKEGLTATLSAVVANLTVVAISQNLLMTSGEFMPLTYGPVAAFTATAGVLGFGVWEFFKRYREQYQRDYLLLVSVVTLLSYATVIFATEQAGAGMREVIMLSLTHGNAAVVYTAVLLEADK
jgi:H+/Cl- antiporter ClcA